MSYHTNIYYVVIYFIYHISHSATWCKIRKQTKRPVECKYTYTSKPLCQWPIFCLWRPINEFQQWHYRPLFRFWSSDISPYIFFPPCWRIIYAAPFAILQVSKVSSKILVKLQRHPSRQVLVRDRSCFTLSYMFHWMYGKCSGMYTLFIRCPTYVPWKDRMTSKIPSRLGVSSAIMVMVWFGSPHTGLRATRKGKNHKAIPHVMEHQVQDMKAVEALVCIASVHWMTNQ